MSGDLKPELRISKADSSDGEFLKLIALLDRDLQERNGEEQQQYDKYNTVDYIKDVILIYSGVSAVGCGAFKKFDGGTVELKRIFVRKEYRKQGISRLILKSLEQLAETQGYKACVLETGLRQVEAINLYRSSGYQIIDNYGPYIGMENSLCMKKDLENSTEG